VEVDAQIKHSSRKLQNSQKIQEQVGNDAERQQAKLHSLSRDLSNARQAADEAAGQPSDALYSFFFFHKSLYAEAYRRASQHNTSLSENSLAEYRSL
jgi:structural maintenance of chromosome 1